MCNMLDEILIFRRGGDFDPNQWEKELSLRDIREVEDLCAGVMEKLGYQVEGFFGTFLMYLKVGLINICYV